MTRDEEAMETCHDSETLDDDKLLVVARCLLQSSGSRHSMFAVECGLNEFVMPPLKCKFSSYHSLSWIVMSEGVK